MIDWTKQAQPTFAQGRELVGYDDYGKVYFVCEAPRDVVETPAIDGRLDPSLFRRPDADRLLMALLTPPPGKRGDAQHGFGLARSS